MTLCCPSTLPWRHTLNTEHRFWQIASVLHPHPGAVAVGARVHADGRGAPRLLEAGGTCGRLHGKLAEAPAGRGGRRHGLRGEALDEGLLQNLQRMLGVGAALR